MRAGFKATNWKWNRKVDIRDKVDRLTLELQAETDEDRGVLARARQAISDAVRLDRKVTDISVTIEGP